MKPTRSFYSAQVADFLSADAESIIGKLSVRLAEVHRQADHSQIQAWQMQINLLKAAFESLGDMCLGWSVLFEAPILRLGRRIDVVVLIPGIVVVLEFKVGAKSFSAQDKRQVEYYALCLRDFHAVSQVRTIVPLLCADKAKGSQQQVPEVDGGVAQTLISNGDQISEALQAAASVPAGINEHLTADDFDRSEYNPTPTIIEAARALYSGHSVEEMGRGDASASDLQASSSKLEELVLSARDCKKKIICFVTGTPGAGKTLLGLNLALRSRVSSAGLPPASLLSGNPPLVHVLVEALAEDAHKNRRVPKATARHEAASAIQGLLNFLREHSETSVPPERVVIFDEAQRAWDADIGLKLLGRKRSEPALFLDIMAQGEWAALICLVGPGQEINRGEGGLSLWGQALKEAAEAGQHWEVWAAPEALDALQSEGQIEGEIKQEPRLHLSSAMRAYRNPLHADWVANLLHGDIGSSAKLASEMQEAPAYISRDLNEAKAWLARQSRGGRSVGLLTSSGAVRLIADGIPAAPRSKDLDAIARWFLKPSEDYRSSGSLELPLSEFGCQGLELDYIGLCWDGDLLWQGGWVARVMSAPNWRVAKSDAKQRFRINGYRVLLTRARRGTVIYVPRGRKEDPTRQPADFDRVAEVLIAAGCQSI